MHDPAIMLASLSGEKVVELNSPEESKHICTIIKEVLKGNSVRSTCLLWDLKPEREAAESMIYQLKYQHKHFLPFPKEEEEKEKDNNNSNNNDVEM